MTVDIIVDLYALLCARKVFNPLFTDTVTFIDYHWVVEADVRKSNVIFVDSCPALGFTKILRARNSTDFGCSFEFSFSI